MAPLCNTLRLSHPRTTRRDSAGVIKRDLIVGMGAPSRRERSLALIVDIQPGYGQVTTETLRAVASIGSLTFEKPWRVICS